MRTTTNTAAAPACGQLLAQQLTEAQRKRLETTIATAAWLYGITIVPIEADDGAITYIASVHALTRSFRSVPEIEGWLSALDALEAPRLEVARFLERPAA